MSTPSRESSIAFSGIGRVRSAAPGIRSSRARRRSQAAIPCSDFQQAGRWSFGESRSRARTPYVCPGRVPGAHILAGDREYFRWRPAFRPQTRSSGPMTGPAFYADDPFDPVIGPLDRVVSLHSKLLTCAAYRDYPLRSR